MPHAALANLVVAAVLCGLIWTIGVVHYPLFDGVPEEAWTAYEARHQERITLIVLAPMLANAGLALALLLGATVGRVRRSLLIANAALALGVFGATGLVFAPIHGELSEGWDAGLHSTLVGLNWLRIVAWTAQVAVAWLIVRALLAPERGDLPDAAERDAAPRGVAASG